jgi:TPP-dependent pyruvate/acetoin dehydrogenase alpha subunit
MDPEKRKKRREEHERWLRDDPLNQRLREAIVARGGVVSETDAEREELTRRLQNAIAHYSRLAEEKRRASS